MNAVMALLTCAGMLLAQDGTTSSRRLTDAESGVLGGFAADQVDATPGADAVERALLEKLSALRAGAGASSKQDEPPAPKAKGKKRKAAKKQPTAAPDTLKSGLTEADRLALGKLVVSELDAGHKGEELVGVLKKELDRLRAERAKATSGAASEGKKKRKKPGK
jgi:hypothetical protein